MWKPWLESLERIYLLIVFLQRSEIDHNFRTGNATIREQGYWWGCSIADILMFLHLQRWLLSNGHSGCVTRCVQKRASPQTLWFSPTKAFNHEMSVEITFRYGSFWHSGPKFGRHDVLPSSPILWNGHPKVLQFEDPHSLEADWGYHGDQKVRSSHPLVRSGQIAQALAQEMLRRLWDCDPPEAAAWRWFLLAVIISYLRGKVQKPYPQCREWCLRCLYKSTCIWGSECSNKQIWNSNEQHQKYATGK